MPAGFQKLGIDLTEKGRLRAEENSIKIILQYRIKHT